MKAAPEVRDIHVPAPLRELPLWLVWSYEQRDGEPKARKVPYYADGGRRYGANGNPTDRAKLTTFAAARDAAAKRGMKGVGFALMPEAGIVALDFDKCVVDRKVDPVVLNLVAGTYAEYSPSGTGVRAFFFGAADALGNPKSIATEEQFGVEVFSSKGFVTVTGNMLDHVDLLYGRDHIAALPAAVIEFCATRFAAISARPDPDDFMAGHEPTLGLTVERMQELLSALDADMHREDWIRVGMALHHECEGDDTGFGLWDDWSADGATYPGTEGLRVQWASFDRRKGSGQANITMATVMKMAKEAGSSAPDINISDLQQQAHELASKLPQVDGVRTPEGYPGKFPVHGAGDPILHQSSEWFIKGVLPKADLIVLYGQSGTGKSFVALDMIGSLARGTQWQGCRVKRAKVVLIAAEGAGGVGKRIRAYCKHHRLNEADLDIGVIRVPPSVIEDVDVKELCTALSLVQADIFVIDTLAQVTPGANENSSEDMGQAIRNIRLITEATGATALVVHHAGKNATLGARGWSGLRAAADAEIEISGHDTSRLISITKMKDGDDSQQWGFQLKQVQVGVDNDGDEETSCVVEYVEAPPKRVKSNEPRGDRQKTILERARHCGAGTPEGALIKDVVDASVSMIPFELVPADGSTPKRDQRRSNITTSLNSLCDKGFLISRDDRLYIKGFEPHYTSENSVSPLDASTSNCFKSDFEDI